MRVCRSHRHYNVSVFKTVLAADQSRIRVSNNTHSASRLSAAHPGHLQVVLRRHAHATCGLKAVCDGALQRVRRRLHDRLGDLHHRQRFVSVVDRSTAANSGSAAVRWLDHLAPRMPAALPRAHCIVHRRSTHAPRSVEACRTGATTGSGRELQHPQLDTRTVSGQRMWGCVGKHCTQQPHLLSIPGSRSCAAIRRTPWLRPLGEPVPVQLLCDSLSCDRPLRTSVYNSAARTVKRIYSRSAVAAKSAHHLRTSGPGAPFPARDVHCAIYIPLV